MYVAFRTAAIISACALAFPAFSCAEFETNQCVLDLCVCVVDERKIAERPGDAAGGVIQDSVDFVTTNTAKVAELYFETLDNSTAEAIRAAINSADKATSDTARNLLQSANDIVDAASAVGRFAERQMSAVPNVLTNAEERLREGKIVDAVWHLAVDHVQATDQNAAKLAQENEIVASAAQAAAGFYGGPGGSAAFAAWKAYHASGGDVGLALKAGAFAYATASGYGDASAMPTGSAGEIAKKAAMVGSVSGIAVAASGGSDEQAVKAFLQSGGAVIVQSGQAYIKQSVGNTEEVKSVQMEADNFCITVSGANCATAAEWVEAAKKMKDEAKRLVDGKPAVVFVPDGDWAISWVQSMGSKQSEGAPSVVLTFVGSGSPYYQIYRELADISGLGLPKASGNHYGVHSPFGSAYDPALYLLDGVRVLYFEKANDGGRVVKALSQINLNYESARGKIPLATNMLTCTKDIPFEAVKSLAKFLLDAGVELRSIQENGVSANKRISLESQYSVQHLPVLSKDSIEAMHTCDPADPDDRNTMLNGEVISSQTGVTSREERRAVIDARNLAARDFITGSLSGTSLLWNDPARLDRVISTSEYIYDRFDYNPIQNLMSFTFSEKSYLHPNSNEKHLASSFSGEVVIDLDIVSGVHRGETRPSPFVQLYCGSKETCVQYRSVSCSGSEYSCGTPGNTFTFFGDLPAVTRLQRFAERIALDSAGRGRK
jgi:hypothetical protein